MTKTEQLQQTWHNYDNREDDKPRSTREAVVWAVEEGILELPRVDPFDVLAEQMAQALRAEMKTDSQGRRYRVNHAVRITKGGVQTTFWGALGYAGPDHMERAFSQRREQIIGDCAQLKTDVDVYNDLVNDKGIPTIQLVLDYTDDVAEREAARTLGKRAA